MIEYKGYQIKPHREIPTMYIVVTSGKGGKIPNMLEGGFTSPTYAKETIDVYLGSKGQVNDKTNSESRG